MTRLATFTLSLAAVALTACGDATNVVAPSPLATGLHAAVTLASVSYTQPFNSALLNACTGEAVTIAGSQVITLAERQTKSGKDFTSMEGVIDGVATTASGATSAFHQTAITTTRQASPEAPIYGKSSYKFTVAGTDDAKDFVVRVSTEFVFEPLTGAFTTTGSSERVSCR